MDFLCFDKTGRGAGCGGGINWTRGRISNAVSQRPKLSYLVRDKKLLIRQKPVLERNKQKHLVLVNEKLVDHIDRASNAEI